MGSDNPNRQGGDGEFEHQWVCWNHPLSLHLLSCAPELQSDEEEYAGLQTTALPETWLDSAIQQVESGSCFLAAAAIHLDRIHTGARGFPG